MQAYSTVLISVFISINLIFSMFYFQQVVNQKYIIGRTHINMIPWSCFQDTSLPGGLLLKTLVEGWAVLLRLALGAQRCSPMKPKSVDFGFIRCRRLNFSASPFLAQAHVDECAESFGDGGFCRRPAWR